MHEQRALLWAADLYYPTLWQIQHRVRRQPAVYLQHMLEWNVQSRPVNKGHELVESLHLLHGQPDYTGLFALQ